MKHFSNLILVHVIALENDAKSSKVAYKGTDVQVLFLKFNVNRDLSLGSTNFAMN